MGTYLCTARDPEGRLVTRRVTASSEVDAAEALEKAGCIPIQIRWEESPALAGADAGPAAAGNRGPGRSWFGSTPPARELSLVTRQLATMVKAGVVVHTALDTAAEQCGHPRLRAALEAVARDVTQGGSISRSLAKHPAVFDQTFVNAIEAGQVSGKLDTILIRLATFMEVGIRRRNSVKAAMRYPVMVMAISFTAFLVLVRFVVPNFKSLFARFNTELPFPTRMLILCHKALSDYALVTALAAGSIVAGTVLLLRTRAGRRFWDRAKLGLPFIGPVSLKSAISTFVQTFNTLNEAGVPILQNLDISAKAIDNLELEARLRRAREGVERGEALSGQIRQIPLFPSLVSQMFAVGEKSGRMADILEPLVAHYDMETEQAIQGLTAAIEPALTVLLGVLVLFLALGIFMPTWELLKVVQK